MKEINLESFRTRSTRKLKKIEPYISKILYLTSFTIFLIENLVIFPDFSAFSSAFIPRNLNPSENLFHFFVWLYFLLFLVFILQLPFYFYNTIKGKIPSSKIRLFEMLSSLVLFIGSSVNNFIPQCIFFMGNCYPGDMIIGLITLFFIAYLTLILERKYYYPRERKFSKLTNQDFKSIDSSLMEEINKIQDEIRKDTREIFETVKLTSQDSKSIDNSLMEEINKIQNKIYTWEETREIFDESMVSSLKERINKIQEENYMLKETLRKETLRKERREIYKFDFKQLEKYSDLIEELSLCYRRRDFLDFYDMKLYRAKALIDDGELEEGIKLLHTLILDSPFEGKKGLYRFAKKQHLLAVYLAKTHQYEAAYNLFIEILKNVLLILVRKLVNFDVLGEVLEHQNLSEASVAAKKKNLKLLYNKLGLEKYYHSIKVYIVLAIIGLTVGIGFIYLLIFLFIWWWF